MKEYIDALNCNLFSSVSQAEDEEGWLAARRMGIGGSDVGALAGMSEWTSPRDVYYSKVSDEDKEFDDASIARMHFGHVLEPIVADEFAANHPELEVVDIDVTLQHPTNEWALGNMDRLLVKDGKPWGVLECKTSSEYMNDSWESMTLPPQYIAQVQWYMYVSDLQFAYIAALVGGNKYYEYGIPRNEAIINNLVECATMFIEESLKKGIAPEASRVDMEDINNSNIDVDLGKIVALEESMDDVVMRYVSLKAEIKDLTKQADDLQAIIKDKVGRNEFGETERHLVAISPRTANRIDSKKLKREFPEVAEAVSVQSSYRVMTVKERL